MFSSKVCPKTKVFEFRLLNFPIRKSIRNVRFSESNRFSRTAGNSTISLETAPALSSSTFLGNKTAKRDDRTSRFLLRASFQPAEKAAPCSINEILYDGFCFLPVLRSEMLNYFNRELMVTGVLIVPPYWARRKNIDCKQENQNFCAPDDSLAFGRFAAFLAWFFNGKNGNGRISEFVIMNEVNAAEWYNVGCGNGKFCDVDRWVDNYARLYNEAYDRIRREQNQAPVLISFEHHFASDFDRLLNQSSPVKICAFFLTLTLTFTRNALKCAVY